MAKKNKKNKEELKQQLYKLIEGIEDEHVLHLLNEEIVPYVIKNRLKESNEEADELTEEQQKRLEKAIKEADEGKTISYAEFKKRMSQWLTE